MAHLAVVSKKRGKITLSSFLRAAFKSLAHANDMVGHEVTITTDTRIRHTCFYELTKEFSVDFPVLDIHYMLAGAFPYSGDLEECFYILRSSGVLRSYQTGEEKIAWDSDSEKMLALQYASIFGDDEYLRMRWVEFVTALRAVMKRSGGVPHLLGSSRRSLETHAIA